MNKDDELLMMKKRIFKMMQLKQKKDKRYDELSKNEIIKEYLALVNDREDLEESIENETKKCLDLIKSRCNHDTYVFKKTNIINSNGTFIVFNFVCAECQYVVSFEFVTAFGRLEEYKDLKVQKLLKFLDSVNVVTSFTKNKEEVIEFFKDYIYYCEYDSIESAESYCRCRMKTKEK